MCGIAGIIGPNASQHSLKCMLSALRHRGPDGHGTLIENRVALGHQRLSILDLSSAANQPFRFGDLSIVFNGEIYNYLELRATLLERGHSFLTTSDTEVLLHAYAEWGEECLNKLDGMWAFCIFNRSNNQVFLARDRFGIKPLYYVWDSRDFYFSSEIKGLLQVPTVSRRMNVKNVADYLILGLTDHNEQTCFMDVHQLAPGKAMRLDAGTQSIQIFRYYDLQRRIEQIPTPSTESYADALQHAIDTHLRSDVAVGTCLSGGLDSSVVAALASTLYRKNSSRPFIAITARSGDPKNDETGYARKVVERRCLEWHTVSPTYDSFRSEFERCLWHQEEPVVSPSVYMQYAVMAKARAVGLKVLLDGQGGDETLAGYERYYVAFFHELARAAKFRTLCSEFFNARRHSKLGFFQLVAHFTYFSSSTLRWQLALRRGTGVADFVVSAARESFETLTRSPNSLRDFQLKEICEYQLPHLLRYEDRNSMAHSIEARVPFLDHHCVEVALALRPEDKIRSGFTKYPSRLVAAKVLPAEIAWRTNKVGFEAPETSWRRQHRGVMLSEIEKSHIIRSMYKNPPQIDQLPPSVAWRLFNLALWERLFKVTS